MQDARVARDILRNSLPLKSSEAAIKQPLNCSLGLDNLERSAETWRGIITMADRDERGLLGGRMRRINK